MKDDAKPKGTWRPPTRRAFVAMLGAAAAALALREKVLRGAGGRNDDPPRSPWTGSTRWIGHC
jgi:hypothetical protein